MFARWFLGKNKKDFAQEFYRITNLVSVSPSMAFVRYGDGEASLIRGDSIDQCTQAAIVDKWTAPGSKTKLGIDLLTALRHKDSNYYYGLPCQCCNVKCKEYLLSKIEILDENITYANLFVNKNYSLFLKYISGLNEEVVLIANQKGEGRVSAFPFEVKYYFSVPDDCVNFWEKNESLVKQELQEIASSYKGTLFLVSAGPLAKVIISYLWKVCPHNRYIDVGSALDEFVHGEKTRPYMLAGTIYNKQYCRF